MSKSEVGAVLRVSEESFMFMGLNVSFFHRAVYFKFSYFLFLIKPD